MSAARRISVLVIALLVLSGCETRAIFSSTMDLYRSDGGNSVVFWCDALDDRIGEFGSADAQMMVMWFAAGPDQQSRSFARVLRIPERSCDCVIDTARLASPEFVDLEPGERNMVIADRDLQIVDGPNSQPPTDVHSFEISVSFQGTPDGAEAIRGVTPRKEPPGRLPECGDI
jgi:hypothetical protein